MRDALRRAREAARRRRRPCRRRRELLDAYLPARTSPGRGTPCPILGTVLRPRQRWNPRESPSGCAQSSSRAWAGKHAAHHRWAIHDQIRAGASRSLPPRDLLARAVVLKHTPAPVVPRRTRLVKISGVPHDSSSFRGFAHGARRSRTCRRPCRWRNESRTAEALFSEGRRLMTEGKLAEACPAFAESQRLEPAPGTALNLAECYERSGKVASAWYAFREAEESAFSRGQRERAAYAKKRAAQLGPKLPRLAVVVPGDALTTGLELRGRERRRSGRVGHAPSVNPGAHDVRATAPKRKPWATNVELQLGGATSVTVPKLDEVPDEAVTTNVAQPASTAPVFKADSPITATSGSSPSTGVPTSTHGRGQRIAGIGVAALGLVGVATGAYFRLRASSTYDDALRACGGTPACKTTEGLQLRHDVDSQVPSRPSRSSQGARCSPAARLSLLQAPNRRVESASASPPCATVVAQRFRFRGVGNGAHWFDRVRWFLHRNPRFIAGCCVRRVRGLHRRDRRRRGLQRHRRCGCARRRASRRSARRPNGRIRVRCGAIGRRRLGRQRRGQRLHADYDSFLRRGRARSARSGPLERAQGCLQAGHEDVHVVPGPGDHAVARSDRNHAIANRRSTRIATASPTTRSMGFVNATPRTPRGPSLADRKLRLLRVVRHRSQVGNLHASRRVRLHTERNAHLHGRERVRRWHSDLRHRPDVESVHRRAEQGHVLPRPRRGYVLRGYDRVRDGLPRSTGCRVEDRLCDDGLR